ncbi:T6SS effector amidase Tae4 family protein [Paraburkholderia sp. J67]|uniref:T6SS effector amidase Tae4 family protein n=1 Tax=Paraburkholderia sp. J67 TaxID=2805435 RepID=UPI002ABD227C|nr:T6SS effector amidase Tae4 family protein [Paraburkholderia sp. J67]
MTHRPLPPFDKLVENYPYRQSVTVLKKMIGGNADDTASQDQWLGGASGDTCTLRMSRAFNYGGGVIPNQAHGMATVKGSDSRRYAFRAREFDLWLRSFYGPPDIEVKGKPVSRDRFLGKKGVISFDITFGLNADQRTRATGHLDLWDGETFFDEILGVSYPTRDFFKVADGVALWLTPGTAVLPRPSRE